MLTTIAILVPVGLAVAGGMISLALNHPEVQKRLARGLYWALAASTVPTLIALHFYVMGMETAATLMDGPALQAVVQDANKSRYAMMATYALIIYLIVLLSFCDWLRSVKKDRKPN